MATWHRRLGRLVAIIFITLLIIIIAPVFLLAFIAPLVVFRWILAKVYILLNCDSAGIIDAQSSVMCTLTRDKSLMRWFITNQDKTTVLLSVLVEDGKLDVNAFRALVSSQIIHVRHGDGSGPLLYPEFQQYPVLWGGYLFWKRDTKFSIENHIKVYENADDWDKRDHAFSQHFVHEYKHAELPSERSPWEVTVIENVRDDFGCLPATHIVFKFPHYFADGHSIFNAIVRLADGGAGSVDRHVHKPSGPVGKFLECVTYPVRGPFDFVSSQFNAITNAPFEKHTSPVDEETAMSEDERHVRGRSVFLSNQCQCIRQLKYIAKKYNVSFTSVLLVCVGRGIRRHLTTHGSPEHVPVYLRTSFAFPSPHRSKSTLMTNDMYIVPVHIPLHDDGFEQQLRELDAELGRLKRSTIHVTMKLIWCLLGILPPTWTWKYAGFGRFFTFDNLLSIFPGPKQNFKILGRKVTGMNYYVDYYYEEADGTTNPVALTLPFTMAILTYGESLQFWISAAPDLVPQNQIPALTRCIEQEIQALE